jgi:hypothetical protein
MSLTLFRYRMAQVSAVATLLGSLLILYAFQASSTDFVVYTNGRYGESAMCIGDPPHALIAMGAQGELILAVRGLDSSCSQGRRFAVVNTESPRLARLGVICMVAGFVAQILCTEKPAAPKEARRRLNKPRKIAA